MSTTTAWIVLFVAGVLEMGWAFGLKYSEGFQRPLPSVLTILAMIASLFMLGLAARVLPIGTAYAVWVGIGAFGAAVLGIVFLHEPRDMARLFFLGLLMVSIVGLKLTTKSA